MVVTIEMIFLRINSHNFSCSMLDTTPTPYPKKNSHRFCTIHMDDPCRLIGGPDPWTLPASYATGSVVHSFIYISSQTGLPI